MGRKFTEILEALREWAGCVPYPAEILRDDGDGLRIIWENGAYLAELIICRAEYAPYHCVSFQILDTHMKPDQEPMYCYYDREDSSIPEIRSALARGIELIKEEREHHA